jgi:hypothetical protein
MPATTPTLSGATVTLNAIRAHGPCEDGWRKLLAHLGKTKPDDEPLPLLTILDSNGVDDALWCLRALPPEYGPACRLLACEYAETVLPIFESEHPDDKRPRAAIETARRHARGEATDTELASAGSAARASAGAAAWASAWASAGSAGASAWDAARAFAWASAGSAGAAAARAAARAAAWSDQERIFRAALA